MRLVLAMSVFACFAGTALAADQVKKVLLISGGPAQQFAGVVKQGGSDSYIYAVAADRIVMLTIQARNEDCDAEMRTDSEHGFMSNFSRFPMTRPEPAKAGENFTVSLHQSRTAWMSRTPCEYRISIE